MQQNLICKCIIALQIIAADSVDEVIQIVESHFETMNHNTDPDESSDESIIIVKKTVKKAAPKTVKKTVKKVSKSQYCKKHDSDDEDDDQFAVESEHYSQFSADENDSDYGDEDVFSKSYLDAMKMDDDDEEDVVV